MGVGLPALHVEAFSQVARETSLMEVCRSLLVVETPREVCAKKPRNDSHKFHLDETRQNAPKNSLGCVIDGEIDEVINVQPAQE